MSRVLFAFAGALALLLGAQSAPAEAGKLGKTIAKTATKTAVKSALKGNGKGGDKDEDDEAPAQSHRSSVDRQVSTVDADTRSAHAKAKLAEEAGTGGVNAGGAIHTASADGNTNSGIVCLAGCN